MRPAILLPLLCLACDPGEARPRAAPGPAPAPAAGDSILRLRPADFPALPAPVRDTLVALGCGIPQSFATDEPHNVVRGALGAPGQEDWAALCSREGASRVVVVWGGPARCGDLGDPVPDEYWVQNTGTAMEYSRRLDALRPGVVAEAVVARGEPAPALGHDVLSDAFLEKASTLHYCEAGRWIELPGAD